jgi:hypothetical protein
MTANGGVFVDYYRCSCSVRDSLTASRRAKSEGSK